MPAPPPPRILPSLPPHLRLVLAGAVVGALFWFVLALDQTPPARVDPPTVAPAVQVPTLDANLLAEAKDQTREQRLLLETEPVRHLLEKAIDVVPTVARALGMPPKPVPLAELRAQPERHRGRWLWYKGELLDLGGPRPGHPVPGYSIHEATVRLTDGEIVFAAFSLPPGSDVQRGGIVRVEGFLLKLRDTNYPRDVQQAPFLIGREIRHDYLDWGKVTELDPARFADLDESCWPGTKAWHTIDEDQEVPLWHLAAFVRDTADQRTFADWRKIGTLNERETLPALNARKLERGTPLRILGTLIKLQILAAPPNPAGIEWWTVAWVQVPDLKGHLVPVWLPNRAELPLRSSLEVCAHYYRWFAYEGRQNDRFRVPLFVAAELREFHRDTRVAMQQISFAVGSVVVLMVLGFWWAQRHATQQSVAHARDLDARRRRRRERDGALAAVPHGAEPGE
jgi:hypothetical protein